MTTTIQKTISCPVVECKGLVIGDFKGKRGKEGILVQCSECGDEYNFQRVDWDDTPPDEVYYSLDFE